MRTIVAALGFLIASIGVAAAQSGCAAFTYGNVLTAGQWNNCLTQKQDAIGYVPVNKAGDSMLGRLVMSAGTTSRSGLSITPGAAPLAPVDGDVWTTNTNFYVQINGVTTTFLTSSNSATITNKVINCNNNTCTIPLSSIATGTQDTVVGYFGSTAASASALSNCPGALTYSTGTHTFGCRSAIVTSVGITNNYGLSVSGSPVTSSGNITADVALSKVTNSLGSDVSLNNTGNYFDGPSVAQGTTGVWFASGGVTLGDSAGAANFACKLWDGTTVIDSRFTSISATASAAPMSLSGYITSPAANIRISCRDITSTSGSIKFNSSGNSKDSTVTAVRIQ